MGADSVAALAYLTLFATVAAFLCYNFALSRLPATRVAVFINAIPVVSLLAAFLILGERLTPPATIRRRIGTVRRVPGQLGKRIP